MYISFTWANKKSGGEGRGTLLITVIGLIVPMLKKADQREDDVSKLDRL